MKGRAHFYLDKNEYKSTKYYMQCYRIGPTDRWYYEMVELCIYRRDLIQAYDYCTKQSPSLDQKLQFIKVLSLMRDYEQGYKEFQKLIVDMQPIR